MSYLFIWGHFYCDNNALTFLTRNRILNFVLPIGSALQGCIIFKHKSTQVVWASASSGSTKFKYLRFPVMLEEENHVNVRRTSSQWLKILEDACQLLSRSRWMEKTWYMIPWQKHGSWLKLVTSDFVTKLPKKYLAAKLYFVLTWIILTQLLKKETLLFYILLIGHQQNWIKHIKRAIQIKANKRLGIRVILRSFVKKKHENNKAAKS